MPGPESIGDSELAVLATDLVGSTALGEQLELDDLAEMVVSAVAGVVSQVESFGGQVLELAGDGVVAVFTGPGAPGRAIAAGLAIAAHVHDRHHAGSATRAALRVGVEAAASVDVAAEAASGLEAQAVPGTVLVGDLARLAAGRGVTWGDRREIDGVGVGTVAERATVQRPGAGRPATHRRTDAETHREERKPIVAVFARIGDSASAPGRTSPSEIVRAFGGRARLLREGVLVGTFGVPVHEDDVERATRAGRELVAEFPAARVGVASGEAALVRHGAGQFVEHTALGDAMNTAARLAGEAEAGELLVEARTFGTVADRFAAGQRRSLRLKGKRQPVEAVSVHDADSGRGRDSMGPLVGRSREIRRLRKAVESALGSDRGWIALSGDPGVGKSMLAGDLARWASARDIGCLTVHAASFASDVPFWPFREVVDELEGDGSSEEERALLDLVRGASHDLVSSRATPEDARQLYEGASEALAALVCRRSARALLVIAEDAHWADPHTVDVLSRLGSASDVAVLVTTRPDEAPAVRELVRGAASTSSAFELRPLDRGGDGALLDELLGPGALPADIEQRILTLGAGNPLYLTEMALGLLEQGFGGLRAGDPRWAALPADAVPTTVERVILQRLDRLDRDARELVDLAAVIGTDVDGDLLARLLGRRVVDEALPRLSGAQVIVPAGRGGDQRFRHVVVREVAYKTLLRSRRVLLHGRVLAALTETQADDPVAWGDLARHALRSSDLDGAAFWGVRAGEHARRQLSFEEAARHYGIASAALRRLEDRAGELTAVLLDRAEVQRMAGLLDEALDGFADAAQLAWRQGDGERGARAALGYELTYFATRRPRDASGSIELLQQALSTDLEPTLVARVEAALATALMYSGSTVEAAALSELATERARTQGDPDTLQRALSSRRLTLVGPVHAAERLALSIDMIQCAEAADDWESLAEAHRLQVMDRLELGDTTGADRSIADFERVAAARPTQLYDWYPSMWRGMRALLDGDLGAADRAIAAFLEHGRASRYADTDLVHAAQAYELARERARPVDVVPLFERLSGATDRMRIPMATLAAEISPAGSALAALDGLVAEDLAAVPKDQSESQALVLLVRAAEATAHEELAAAVYERLAPWAGTYLVVGAGALFHGAADHALGRLAALLGRPEQAREHLSSGIASDDSAGARLHAAHARCELAALIASDDPETARELVAHARAAATSTGSERLRSRVETLERLHPVTRRTARAGRR